MLRIPFVVLLCLLSALLLVLVLWALGQGAVDIGFAQVWGYLWVSSEGLTGNTDALIVQQIRLPRIVLCLLMGALLAICGAVMQGLFRNPLADPGIIGVSSGASLGAGVALILLPLLALDLPLLPLSTLCAFIGGGVTTLLVYRIGRGRFGTSVGLMLLAGVAISALSGAAIGLLTYLADDSTLRNFTLWQMGSLAGASHSALLWSAATLVLLLVLFQRDANALNALLLGEAQARYLGVNVQALKRRLIWLTALGVGVSVANCGIIGFVGLVVPHWVRLLVGPNHRHLLPLSALMGAMLLLLADTLARTLVVPAEMPVGIITALIGAPFFIVLLIQQKRKELM